ncbi:MAG: alpha/beta hydrolase [Candidatus Promineifilaceae bacterium]|nr:alpha/beta hydrolase [Candidatus Promineifilaceae bacterium]
MKGLLDRSYWLGVGLTAVGLLSYVIQLTPIIFFFDFLWPRTPHSLGLSLVGLVLMIGGTLAHSSKRRVIILLGAVILIAWFIASTFLIYREEIIDFASDEAHLYGTLYVPQNDGPHPALIIVHGKAPNTRAPYRAAAEQFVRQGIATLVYDKRGFGASEGPLPYTYDQLAQDTEAGFVALQQHSQIDPARIGFIGYSEGGFVAPLAASRLPDAATLILVSGGGVPPSRTVHFEMETRLRIAGFSAAEVAEALTLMQGVDNYYRTHTSEAEVMAMIKRAKQSRWFETAFEMEPEAFPDTLDAIPFTDNYPANLDFEPLTFLTRLDMPILFIFGEADTQVPADESAAAIRTALTHAGKQKFHIELFPMADHIIFIDYQPAPGYPELVNEWLQNHLQ